MGTPDINKIITLTIDGALNYCTMSLFREKYPMLVKKSKYDDVADNYVLNRLCCGTLVPLESNKDYTLLKSTCSSVGGFDWYVIMNNRKHTSCLEFETFPTPISAVHLNEDEVIISIDINTSARYTWKVGEYEFNEPKAYRTYHVNDCLGLVKNTETNFPQLYAQCSNTIFIAEAQIVKNEWTSHPIYCALFVPKR